MRAKALTVSSNLTWSFPFPVGYMGDSSSTFFFCYFNHPFAIIGLAKDVPSRYLPSYIAPAFKVG